MEIFTVSQLADHVRSTLERDSLLRDVWVSGEVTNVFQSGAGHVYFAVKDANAAMKSVLFAGNAGSQHLISGAQVNAHGRVSYYQARGETQIYVDLIIPAGEGELAAEFERLRTALEAEGLFNPSRKRSLPAFPVAIGVVTSEQGAVIHDIMNVLAHRYPLANLILFPATVQGDSAPSEIAEGIRALNALGNISVIIVGRGGGSMEDLWAFNTEEVARAIYGSHVPIVSAVGHESDFTIADFVADLRAPTPSAAAAAVSPDIQELRREVLNLTRHASQHLKTQLMQHSSAIEIMVSRMQRTLIDTDVQRQRIDDVLERGRTALQTLFNTRRHETLAMEAALGALSPIAVLERGFAVVMNSSTGATISSVRDVAPDDIVRVQVKDGFFETDVRP